MWMSSLTLIVVLLMVATSQVTAQGTGVGIYCFQTRYGYSRSVPSLGDIIMNFNINYNISTNPLPTVSMAYCAWCLKTITLVTLYNSKPYANVEYRCERLSDHATNDQGCTPEVTLSAIVNGTSASRVCKCCTNNCNGVSFCTDNDPGFQRLTGLKFDGYPSGQNYSSNIPSSSNYHDK